MLGRSQRGRIQSPREPVHVRNHRDDENEGVGQVSEGEPGALGRRCRAEATARVHEGERALETNLANGAHGLCLLLVDLASRERPARSLLPSLDQQDLSDGGARVSDSLRKRLSAVAEAVTRTLSQNSEMRIAPHTGTRSL